MVIEMKKRYISFLLATLFAFSVCSTTGLAVEGQTGGLSSAEEDAYSLPQKTIISFDEASDAQIVELLNESDVTELQTTSTVNGEIYTTGYVLAETTELDDAINNFEERYYSMLLETKEAYKDNNPEMYAVFEARLENYIAEGMSISAVVVDGELNGQVAQEVKNNDLVRQIESISVSPSSNSDEARTRAAAATGNWVPTSGSAAVWNSTQYDDAVYMNLNWSWDSDSDMTLYQNTDNVTLEAEIVFYNYDGEGHAVGWYSGDWTYDTNQPSPYIDTQFNFGNKDEVPYTIGSYDATEFESGKNYYWVCFGDVNNPDGSKAKIYFQRGHKLFGISSTWTIFADETEIVVGFNDWNTGTKSTITF